MLQSLHVQKNKKLEWCETTVFEPRPKILPPWSSFIWDWKLRDELRRQHVENSCEFPRHLAWNFGGSLVYLFHGGKAMIKSRRLSLFYMIYGKIFHFVFSFFSFCCTHWGIICPLIDPKWDLGTTCRDAVQLFEPIIKLQKRKTTGRWERLVRERRMMASWLVAFFFFFLPPDLWRPANLVRFPLLYSGSHWCGFSLGARRFKLGDFAPMLKILHLFSPATLRPHPSPTVLVKVLEKFCPVRRLLFLWQKQMVFCLVVVRAPKTKKF